MTDMFLEPLIGLAKLAWHMEINCYRDQFIKDWLANANIEEIYCFKWFDDEGETIKVDIDVTSYDNNRLSLELDILKGFGVTNPPASFFINKNFVFSYECDVTIYTDVYELMQGLPEKVKIGYWD